MEPRSDEGHPETEPIPNPARGSSAAKDEDRDAPLDVFVGIALAFLLAAAQLPFVLIFPPLSWLMGLAQLIYVVPLIRRFHRDRRFKMATGLTIGAALVFLLNATCMGFTLFSGKSIV